ncbi:YppG family protein [Neobacillus mesonae]|uniref:YppG family protein n=1 Tax=Neobacillus mesonae TaxID=1193713 RepID=UPI00203AFBB2|nr:YppG family protein [Neobacillus mesonae]MCM3566829.1 YppG family protein [Neobacillus mesonae]
MFAKKKAIKNVNNGFQRQMMYQGPFGRQQNQQPFYQNKPFSMPSPMQNREWNPYQQQNLYYPQGYQPYGNTYQATPVHPNMSIPNQYYSQKDSQFLFQNPLQPKEEMMPKPYMPMNGHPIMNPYPKQSFIPKQPSGVQSIMNSFKSQDGSVDFNKMMNTAGQMMNAVTQVSSLVKGIGGIFKA